MREVAMTRKEKILRMVQRLDEAVTLDEVIYHLVVMRDVEIGLEQASRGEGTDHEALFRRLEKEWQEKDSKSSGRQKAKKDSSKSATSLPKTTRARQTRSRSA
jgi:hypothetical protein